MSSSGDFHIQRIWTTAGQQTIEPGALSAKQQAFSDVVTKVKAASDPAFTALQKTLNTEYKVEFVKVDATGEITATFETVGSSSKITHRFTLIGDDSSSLNKDLVEHLRAMWKAVMEEPIGPASSHVGTYGAHAVRPPTGTVIGPDQGILLEDKRKALLEQVQIFKNTSGSDAGFLGTRQTIETNFTNKAKEHTDLSKKRLFSAEDLAYLPNTDDTTLRFLDLALLEDIQRCIKEHKFEEAALTITLLNKENKTAILTSLNIPNPGSVTFSNFDTYKGSLVRALTSLSFHPQPIIESLKTTEILEIIRYITECKTKAQAYSKIESAYKKELTSYWEQIVDLERKNNITTKQFYTLSRVIEETKPTLEGVANLQRLINQTILDNCLIAQKAAKEQKTLASDLQKELALLKRDYTASLSLQSFLLIQLTDKAGNIRDLEESLTLATTRIAQQNAHIESLNSQLESANTKNSQLQAQVAALQANRDQEIAKLAAIEAAIEALDDQQKVDIQKIKDEHSNTLAELQTTHAAAIAELRATQDATQAAALKQAEEQHAAAIAALQASQAAKLETIKASYEQTIANLTQTKQQAEANADRIQKELTSAQSRIKEQETTIESLQKDQQATALEIARLQQEAEKTKATHIEALDDQAKAHEAAIEKLSADNEQALAAVRQEALTAKKASEERLRALRAELKEFVHREQLFKTLVTQLGKDQASARTTIEHLQMTSQANKTHAETLYKDRETLLKDLSSKATSLLQNSTIDETQKTEVRSLLTVFEAQKDDLSSIKALLEASLEAYLKAGALSIEKYAPTKADSLARYVKNQASMQTIESNLMITALQLSQAIEQTSTESLSSLKKTLDTVTASYQEASAAAQKSQAELAAKEKAFSELTEHNTVLEERLRQSDAELKKIRSDLEKQTTILALQTDTIKALEAKLTAASIADATKISQFKKLEEALEARIAALTATSLAEQEKASALEQQLAASQEAKASIQAAFDDLNDRAKTIARENTALARANAALESHLKANLTAVIFELKKTLPSLDASIVDALSGEALIHQHQTLTQELFTQYSANLTTLEEQRLKLATQEAELAKLTATIKSQQASLQETKRSLETLQQTLTQASSEKSFLKDALDEATASLKAKEAEIAALHAQLKEASASSTAQTAHVQELSSSLENAKKAYETLERDHITLNESLKAANETLSSLQKLAEEREALIQKQASTLLEKQKRLDTAIEENRTLKGSLEAKETEHAMLQATLAEAQASIKITQDAQALSERFVEDARQAFAKERAAILQKNEATLHAMRAEMEATIERMKAEHKVALATLESKHTASITTASDKAKATLEAEIASLEAAHEQSLLAVTTPFEALQAQHIALQEAASLKDAEVAQLSLELTTLREKFSTTQAERNAALEETAGLRAELAAAVATFSTKEADLEEALKANKALEEDLKQNLFTQLDIIIHPFINPSDGTVSDEALATIAKEARIQKENPSSFSLPDVIGLTNRSIPRLLTILAEKTAGLEMLESELEVAEKELTFAKPATLKARIAAITLEIQRNKVAIDQAKKAAALAQAKEAETLRQKQALGRENTDLKADLDELKKALVVLTSAQDEMLATYKASPLSTLSLPTGTGPLRAAATGGSGTDLKETSSAVRNLGSAMDAASVSKAPLLTDFPQLSIENVDKVHQLLTDCELLSANPRIKDAVIAFKKDAALNLEIAFSKLAEVYKKIKKQNVLPITTSIDATPERKASEIKIVIENIDSPAGARTSTYYARVGASGGASALSAAATLYTKHPSP